MDQNSFLVRMSFCFHPKTHYQISEEVLEGPQSVAFDQAENKKHLHKAILEHFILKTAV